MVRINSKAIDDFLAKAQDTLQNSLIETGYSFTYNTGTLNYVLPGFAIDNERIYSIESIEGIGFLPEDYIISSEDLTEGELSLGYDYELYDNYVSPEIVPNGYGVTAGEQVYTGVTIADQTFKDNSIIYIKYKYQNTNFIPILTNFSPNSVLRMILTATLLNIQETNEELTQSIETFGLGASGDDLDRIASLVGLDRTEAVFTGDLGDGSFNQIKIINNDTVNYSINTGHRFAAISGGTFLAFKPITGISVPSDGGEVFIDVIAVESGSYYNVGSNSITLGFSNQELTAATPTTLVISNPPLGDIGQQNLFNNGQDEETDDDFRKRVSLAFSQAKTSSYSTIENAVINTGLATYVKVYDIDLKKNLVVNAVQTYIATETGNRLAASSFTQILENIQAVKPAGSRPSVRQVLNTFINFDFNIYVDQNTIGDTTDLEEDLNSLLDEFINTKGIGEDILPSAVVSLLKAVSEVVDLEINSHTITEFTCEAPDYIGTVQLATTGSADNWVALEIPFNSATNLVNDTEINIAGNAYDLSSYGDPYPIDDRTTPRINIGVTGYDGLIRPSPLDTTDYQEGSTTRTTMPYNPTLAGGDGISTTDEVLFNYNYFDNTKLDGFRIRLNGTDDNVVRFDFGYGTSPNDDGDFTSILNNANYPAQSEIDVTLDGEGLDKMYDVSFAEQIELNNFGGSPVATEDHSPDSTTYWLIVKHQSGAGDSWIPVNTAQTAVAYSPAFFEDADADGVAYETESQQRANWHSYTTHNLADAYKKIIIPSHTDEPEKPISYNHTFTFSLFVEE